MKRKALGLVSVLGLAVTLVGCGGESDGDLNEMEAELDTLRGELLDTPDFGGESNEVEEGKDDVDGNEEDDVYEAVDETDEDNDVHDEAEEE